MRITLAQEQPGLAIGATATLRLDLAAAGAPPMDSAALLGVTAGAFAEVTLGTGLELVGGVLQAAGGGSGYTLPQASAVTLGGVKVGSNITVAAGVISLAGGNVTAALGYTPQDAAGLAKVATTGAYADLSGTPAAYTLPQASAVTLGGVKIGSNITVAAGVISLSGGNVTAALGLTPVNAAGAAAAAPVQSVAGRTGSVTLAAADVSGLSKVATTGAYGDLTGAPAAYTLPQADAATLGGVKIGSNITVAAGVISLSGSNVTAALGLTPVNAAGAAAAAPVQSVAGRTGSVTLAAADVSGLSKVATSGAYGDLTGAPAAYTLPQADAATLGGVKIGSNISVAAGVISLTGGNVTAALGFTPPDAAATVTTDKFMWNGIPLTGATYKKASNFATAAGNNDLYTVPAGKKAVLVSNPVYVNDTAGSITVYSALKRGGTYYRLGANAAVSGGSVGNPGATFAPIMVAGDIFAINDNTGGGGVVVGFMEFNDTVPVASAIVTAVAGANTLYTVPAGKVARVLWPNGETLMLNTGGVAHSNASGGAITRNVYYVPSGGSASAQNEITPSGGSSTSNNNVASTGAVPVLAAGDAIQVNLSGTGATQMIGMNYHERAA